MVQIHSHGHGDGGQLKEGLSQIGVGAHRKMSAFGGKADILDGRSNVRFTPQSGHWLGQSKWRMAQAWWETSGTGRLP